MRRGILLAGPALALMAPAIALALRAASSGPILARVPIGLVSMPRGMAGAWPAVDGRSGRVYILDNGVSALPVTLTASGGISYTLASPYTAIQIVDARGGRLARSIQSAPMMQALIADPVTGRFLAFDPQDATLSVLDADGRALTVARFGEGRSDPFIAPQVQQAVVDARSGQVFVVTAQTSQARDQRVLLIDGHTGASLTAMAFAPGRPIRSRPPGGQFTIYYPMTLSLAADPDHGRVDVFNADGHMLILNGADGRLLTSRPLPFLLAGAVVDGRSDRVFAFDGTRNPDLTGRPFPSQAGRIVMLDAASGALLRAIPGGTTGSGAGALVVDEAAGRVYAADPVHRAVLTLDATSGALLRTTTLSSAPTNLLLDAPRGRLYAAAGQQLAILDTGGAFLRAIALPLRSTGMALDAETGRLIVVGSALTAPAADPWGWLPGCLRAHLPGIPAPPPPSDPDARILHSEALVIDPNG